MSQLALYPRESYHGEEADSNTGNQTADVEHFDNHAGRLNGTTYNEYAASHQNGSATTKSVSEGCKKCSAEAASGEQGDHSPCSRIAILLKKQMFERVGGHNFCDDTADDR